MNIEKNLWTAANQLRANSGLKSSEYSYPVLGLIFLKFADYKFTLLEKELSSKFSKRNRKIGKEDYLAKGAMYLNDKARFKYLLQIQEGENIGQKVNDAMLLIEKDNPDLKDTLPKVYNKFSSLLLVELLRLIDGTPNDIEGDTFGKIYEYFLGEFAMNEGRRGGEFFTPTSIVKLIVEIIEPFEGRIYDPACGSGGMFVQSARFVKEHKSNSTKKISIYGQEKEEDTVRLNKMNLAVNGLAGDIRQGISYYEDLHNSINKFDYVMANPPFNVEGVNKEKIKKDKRYPFGIPKNNNANYLWIQLFFSALNDSGRAGFIMANTATDSGHSELTIRKKIINQQVIDMIISMGPKLFYNVTLPCTLWFFDKAKKKTKNKNKILFIDAKKIFFEIDRAHRKFTPEQIEFISNIVRLYRGEKLRNDSNGKSKINEIFNGNTYVDVLGLCKIVTIDEIMKKNCNLNPGYYVGVSNLTDNDNNFRAEYKNLNSELEVLNKEASDLQIQISNNATKLLKGK